MDRIFAAKEDSASCQKVRLITIWLGTWSHTRVQVVHKNRLSNERSLTILTIGTNDSVVPSPTERKDVSVERFEENINKIIHLLVDSSSPYAVAHDTHPLSIILITPPMFHEDMRPDPSNVTNERCLLYRQAVLRVGEAWKRKESGQRWKIGSIDLYGMLEKARESGDSKRFYVYVTVLFFIRGP